MAKQPKKRRARPARRRTKRRSPPDIGDLDLRTLVVLSVGGRLELGDHRSPPERICRWLETADIRQLRGLLLATIGRMQKLQSRYKA